MAGGNRHVLLSKVALKSQDPNLVSWGLGVPAVGGTGGRYATGTVEERPTRRLVPCSLSSLCNHCHHEGPNLLAHPQHRGSDGGGIYPLEGDMLFLRENC